MLRWILLTISLVPVGAHANTWDVCNTNCTFTSLNQAVAVANQGDVIQVHPGIYAESLDITKDLHLIGTGGSDETWITGSSGTTTLSIRGGATVSIEGFRIGDVGQRAITITEGAWAGLTDVALRDLEGTFDGLALRIGGGSTVQMSNGGVFDSSTSGTGNHLIRVDEESTFIAYGTEFSNLGGGEGNSSAFHLGGASTATFTQVAFVDNLGSSHGAALSVTPGTVAVIEKSAFRRNGSAAGGAIAVSSATLVIGDSTFEDNHSGSPSGGGAILGEGAAEIDVRGSDFVGNDAISGGAIRIGGEAVLEIRDTEFRGNVAEIDGGAIALHGTSPLLIIDSQFRKNTASTGGAVSWQPSHGAAEVTATVVRSMFQENSAGSGGGLWATNAGPWVLDDVEFTDNIASDTGGAFQSDGPEVSIEQSLFRRNVAAAGGAVHVSADSLTVADSRFDDNRATDIPGGGAILADGVEAIDVRVSEFVGNEAISGGAILVPGDSALEIHLTTFAENVAEDQGGAAAHLGNAPLQVEYSHFRENIAREGGALTWRSPNGPTDASAFVVGSSFVENSAEVGGGIWTMGTGSWVLVDNVFRGNGATRRAGAFLADEIASLQAWNNWFCLNVGNEGGGAVDLGTLAEAGQWTNNFFLDNFADLDEGLGGALRTSGSAHVSFNTFLGNRASEGASIHSGGTLLFRNNAIAWSAGLSVVYVAEDEGVYGYNLFHENDGSLPNAISLNPGNVFLEPGFYAYEPGMGCDADLRVRFDGGLVQSGGPELENPDGSRADIGGWGGPLGSPSAWVDTDEDGWPWIYDCDDEDPGVHPWALEVCDGRDTSCSGAIDDVGPEAGAPMWYRDADGDGFGDPDQWIHACSQPEGYVENGLDCDDSDPEVHPAAIEICDGRDTSCTGTVDGDENGPLDCECLINETRDCYEGPEGTKDVGVCVGGTQTCVNGAWGPCEHQVLPAPEDDCDTLFDETCNGIVNDGCGEEPNGADPNGQDIDEEEPNPEDGPLEVGGCGCSSSNGEGLVALVLLGLAGLHARVGLRTRHDGRREA